MTSLSVALGDAPPASDTCGLLNKPSLKDCEPENLLEQSLQSLHISVLASQLASSSVFVPMDLAAFVPALASDAIVSICVLDASKHDHLATVNSDFQPIHTAFLLAGLKQTTESKRADGSITWTATKLAVNGTNNAVRLSRVFAMDGNTDNDEIDEDGLLHSDDAHALLAAPPAMTAVRTKGGGPEDDCGGREPCENCSCGRAAGSMSSDEKKTSHDHTTGNSSSNCGKCSLGDAFRCASCPHLGKPAWKPGEERLVLSLDLQDDF